MGISTNQGHRGRRIDYIVLLLFIVVILGGIVSIIFNSSQGQAITGLVIAVVGLVISFIQVRPDFLKGMKITLPPGKIGFIRIITVALLIVVIILQIVSFYDKPYNQVSFLAVGEAGTVLTSPDGKNWTTESSGSSKNLQGVVWSGSRF